METEIDAMGRSNWSERTKREIEKEAIFEDTGTDNFSKSTRSLFCQQDCVV
jgi:hypothetical protein